MGQINQSQFQDLLEIITSKLSGFDENIKNPDALSKSIHDALEVQNIEVTHDEHLSSSMALALNNFSMRNNAFFFRVPVYQQRGILDGLESDPHLVTNLIVATKDRDSASFMARKYMTSSMQSGFYPDAHYTTGVPTYINDMTQEETHRKAQKMGYNHMWWDVPVSVSPAEINVFKPVLVAGIPDSYRVSASSQDEAIGMARRVANLELPFSILRVHLGSPVEVHSECDGKDYIDSALELIHAICNEKGIKDLIYKCDLDLNDERILRSCLSEGFSSESKSRQKCAVQYILMHIYSGRTDIQLTKICSLSESCISALIHTSHSAWDDNSLYIKSMAEMCIHN